MILNYLYIYILNNEPIILNFQILSFLSIISLVNNNMKAIINIRIAFAANKCFL